MDKKELAKFIGITVGGVVAAHAAVLAYGVARLRKQVKESG